MCCQIISIHVKHCFPPQIKTKNRVLSSFDDPLWWAPITSIQNSTHLKNLVPRDPTITKKKQQQPANVSVFIYACLLLPHSARFLIGYVLLHMTHRVLTREASPPPTHVKIFARKYWTSLIFTIVGPTLFRADNRDKFNHKIPQNNRAFAILVERGGNSGQKQLDYPHVPL